MKEYTIYQHVCPNGMVYVGQTCQNLKVRWNYGLGYRNNKRFYDAIKEYGWNNISHITLYTGLTKQEADEIEISLISRYKAANLSYNICTGGSITDSSKGHTHTEEAKRKMSASHKGKPSWNRGRTLSEEHRKKLSEANRGKPSWNRGRTTSDETKQKMSESMVGKNKGKHRVYREDGTYYYE